MGGSQYFTVTTNILQKNWGVLSKMGGSQYFNVKTIAILQKIWGFHPKWEEGDTNGQTIGLCALLYRYVTSLDNSSQAFFNTV